MADRAQVTSILANLNQQTIKRVCEALGLPYQHAVIDAIYEPILWGTTTAYGMGVRDRLDVASELSRAGEAVLLRYLPTAGDPGDVPVYGETTPYVQPRQGEAVKRNG